MTEINNEVIYRDDFQSLSNVRNDSETSEQSNNDDAQNDLQINQEAQELQQNEEIEVDSIEDKARRMGWVSKDKYKGNPDTWTTAEEFVRKGENELPVVKENFRRLDKKYKELEKDLALMRDNYSSFEKKAYEKAIAEIKNQQKFAVEDGDVDKYERLELQKEELSKEVKEREVAKTPNPQPEIPQEVYDWVEKNSWYNEDMELQAKAEDYSSRLSKSKPHLSLEENLKEVERQIKTNFPEKFGNSLQSSRRQPVDVLPTNNVTGATSKRLKTFSDLPPEAQQVCLAFERRKAMTREKYINEYFNQ